MDELLDYMVRVRREFHAWPELGYKEEKTAERIWEELLLALPASSILGRIAGTGIIARLEGKEGGPTIAFRADMDGLPITEKNDIPYKSQNDGVMHSCGHDGHMAMLLGLAKRLSAERERIHGNALFIFQPAEEGGAGGKKIAESEIYARYAPHKIFGLHLWNDYPVGTILARPGMQQAGSRQISVVFHGPGGHAAYLYRTKDPIDAAALLRDNLKNLHRELYPWHEFPIVHCGYFHAGDAANVVASRAEVRFTIRVYKEAAMPEITNEIERRAKAIAALVGIPDPTITYSEGYIPLVNRDAETDLVLSLARSLGYEARTMPPKPGADDFAFFLKRTPGCYFNVGSGNSACGLTSPHHSPTFDFDEDALLVGCNMFSAVAEHYLMQKP